MRESPQIKCPTCRKTGDWFAGQYGPFCSQRCRLIDLGKWFAEEHAVSSPLRPEQLEQLAGLPAGQPGVQPETDLSS